jgi:Uma2 family endonuclease
MSFLTQTISSKRPFFFDGEEIHYPTSDGKPIAETDTHREQILALIKALEIFFAARADVYVSGNIMFYYVEGSPEESVAPDVMVCFGTAKGERTSYKTWEENEVVPSIVIEISSRGTWKKDRVEKKVLYAALGVKEYFIFNPLDLKSESSFVAFRLKNGEYDAAEITNGRVRSEVLGLDLVVSGKTLRLFNPQTNEFLKTTEELAAAVDGLTEENTELKSEIERLKKLLNENQN